VTLSVATTALANAAVGVPYGATLAASGGTRPYSWTSAAGNLPAGLNLTSNGTITGVPSSPGPSTFTVSVTDSTAPVARTAKVNVVHHRRRGPPYGRHEDSAQCGVGYAVSGLADGARRDGACRLLTANGFTVAYGKVPPSPP
jgi:hypothetical protein